MKNTENNNTRGGGGGGSHLEEPELYRKDQTSS